MIRIAKMTGRRTTLQATREEWEETLKTMKRKGSTEDRQRAIRQDDAIAKAIAGANRVIRVTLTAEDAKNLLDQHEGQ
jgi:hypothetical protein